MQPGPFQEDLYPPTAGNRPAVLAEEWLSGVNRGQFLLCSLASVSCSFLIGQRAPPPSSDPVLMSLRPGGSSPYPVVLLVDPAAGPAEEVGDDQRTIPYVSPDVPSPEKGLGVTVETWTSTDDS